MNRLILTLCFAIIFAAFGYSQTNKNMSDSIIDVWSGKHITMEITENGAIIEYDCAKGTIDKKIAVKKDGFSVIGTFSAEHGGPVRMDENSNAVAVDYIARIAGRKMTLTVKDKETGKLIGKFVLYKGREPYLTKCR